MIAEAGFSEGAMSELSNSGSSDVAEVAFLRLRSGVSIYPPLLAQVCSGGKILMMPPY